MITSFPAVKGTFLLVLDESDMSVREVPVFGWQTGYAGRVTPLLATDPIKMGRGVAICMPHPDPEDSEHRVIADPVFDKTFETVEQWAQYVSQQPEVDGLEPFGSGLEAGLGVHVYFDDHQTYRKGSFWQYQGSDGAEFVFEVPASSPIPDDSRVSKITRNIFMRLRKTQPVVQVETLYGDQSRGSENSLDEEAKDLV